MNAFKNYFKELFSGAWSLVAGLAVTIRYMFKPVATVQYPRRKLALPEAYRGHIEFKKFADTNSHHCVACGECARTCPSKVIKVQGLKAEAADDNHPRFYIIDYSRCSFCGLCVQVCPQKTLQFSQEYEQVGDCPWVGVVDLIARMQKDA
jgi:NADH-quinone oxidoreductase subunit I